MAPLFALSTGELTATGVSCLVCLQRNACWAWQLPATPNIQHLSGVFNFESMSAKSRKAA